MNITLSFIINTATYVVVIVVVLYRTFKDKIMKPFWKRLIMALSAFAFVAVVGSAGFLSSGQGATFSPLFLSLHLCADLSFRISSWIIILASACSYQEL